MKQKSLISLLLWLVIAYAGYYLIKLSFPYLAFKPNIDFLRTKQLIYHKDLWRWAFYIHVFSSPLAFVAALLQFLPFIKKKVGYHKIIGLIYLVSFLGLAGPSGMILAIYANGGIFAQASFVLLSFAWLYTGLMAWRTVRNKNYEAHSKWVMRSIYLMGSAIMLRTYALLIAYFNLDIHPKSAYILIAWLSWTPNVIVGEFILSTTRFQKFLRDLYWPK